MSLSSFSRQRLYKTELGSCRSCVCSLYKLFSLSLSSLTILSLYYIALPFSSGRVQDDVIKKLAGGEGCWRAVTLLSSFSPLSFLYCLQHSLSHSRLLSLFSVSNWFAVKLSTKSWFLLIQKTFLVWSRAPAFSVQAERASDASAHSFAAASDVATEVYLQLESFHAGVFESRVFEDVFTLVRFTHWVVTFQVLVWTAFRVNNVK